MPVTLRPFKELIALSKEKLDEAMAPVRARKVKAVAELELAELDTELVNNETKLQEICTSKDINFKQLMDTLDDIALVERRQKQYSEVLEQLFPKA